MTFTREVLLGRDDAEFEHPHAWHIRGRLAELTIAAGLELSA